MVTGNQASWNERISRTICPKKKLIDCLSASILQTDPRQLQASNTPHLTDSPYTVLYRNLYSMNQFLPLELCLVERAQRMRCRLGAHHRFELYTDKILVFKWRMVERRAIIHQLHHRPAGIAWPLKKKLHLFIP